MKWTYFISSPVSAHFMVSHSVLLALKTFNSEKTAVYIYYYDAIKKKEASGFG